MKYGLFKYETENIGDEIQSIAARRFFLPSVDAYIDRDRLGEYCPDEETKNNHQRLVYACAISVASKVR